MRFITLLTIIFVAAIAAMPGLEVKGGALTRRGTAIEAVAHNVSMTLDNGNFEIGCQPAGWEDITASCSRTREGIAYLRDKDTKGIKCGVDTDASSRISCSWGAGIFVHNFDTTQKNGPREFRCGELADYAEMILKQCGGDRCMTDTKRPGMCITGFYAEESFAVTVSLQNC